MDKIKRNNLMNEKYKKACKYLKSVEYLLILDLTVTGCVSISLFVSLVCISCKKYTANENSNVRKTKQNRLMLLSNYALCDKKKQLLLKNKNSTILMINLNFFY